MRLLTPLALVAALATAAPAAPPATPWWRHAVFYEIYPRSFQDSDGDGVGDLNGITSRLDYLADLGVDALWITPFYPSPQVDFGYDVSDYEAVDPQFGTLADLDRLVTEAKKRGIRIVMDMVLNHTSDRHAWFVEARASRTAPRRDWFVWKDGTAGRPPNNWYSGFGPTAWAWDEKTKQFYYHFFYAEQPDLNWRNPQVEKAMFRACRFWLDRGVAGFRLDAVNWLFEDPQLRDNPELDRPRMEDASQKDQVLKFNRDLPETHGVLQRLRKVADEYGPDRLLIGEIWVNDMDALVEYYGPKNDEVHLPFNFFFTKVPKLDAALFRAEVEKAERALAGRPTTWVLSNHDIVRAGDRYGDSDGRVGKLLAALLLTLRGAPFIYYGEEIGMVTTDPQRLDDVRDPVGRRYWPRYKGRDGVRTPMQWDAGVNAGFSTGTPWLPVPALARERNVARAAVDAGSVLSFYKQLLRLRRRSPALLEGDWTSLGGGANVLAYRRSGPQQTLVVALNMSPHPQRARLLAGRVVLSSVAAREGLVADEVELAPYEALLVEPTGP